MYFGVLKSDGVNCLDIHHRAPIELVALLKSVFLSLRMQLENRYVS